MVNRSNTPKVLRRFIINRKGTAEVIGSVLFIIILMFAFTNIYLWHDTAVKSMNTQLSDKLNSQIDVHWLLDSNDKETSTLVITNTGGVDTQLSRLWIVDSGQHLHFDLSNRYISAGQSIEIDVSASPISHAHTEDDGVTYSVLTTLGNMASPRGTITIVNSNNGGGDETSNDAIGSIIVADYDTFKYYTVQNSQFSLSSEHSGYQISTQDNIVFKVSLTNDGQETIVLDSNSQMFFIGTKNTGSNNVGYWMFNIVSVDINGNTGTLASTYDSNDYTFDSGVTITVYFTGNFNGLKEPQTCPLNLALHGTMAGSLFGQNIPFVTTRVDW
jgi:archaellum component FlaF (FlaF/FlaG flagellin family)